MTGRDLSLPTKNGNKNQHTISRHIKGIGNTWSYYYPCKYAGAKNDLWKKYGVLVDWK